MSLKEQYEKETGEDWEVDNDWHVYVEWLEKEVEIANQNIELYKEINKVMYRRLVNTSNYLHSTGLTTEEVNEIVKLDYERILKS